MAGIHVLVFGQTSLLHLALAKAKQGRREGGGEKRGGRDYTLFKPSWLPYSSVVSSLTEVSCSSWPVCSGVGYFPAGL